MQRNCGVLWLTYAGAESESAFDAEGKDKQEQGREENASG